MKYRGNKQRSVCFPLGGLGSGCIGLTGWGSFKNFEIFGKPNKESYNGFTHFAVRTEENGKPIDCRVLSGDCPGPYIGYAEGLGSGLDRHSTAGFPHFQECVFDGEFPIATLSFRDEGCPLIFRLRAFNPFIPLQSADSSLPVAMFELEVKNPTSRQLSTVVGLSLGNPLPGRRVHFAGAEPYPNVLLKTEDGENSLCVACDGEDCSVYPYWLRSGWYDSAGDYWQAFSGSKEFVNYSYPPQDGYEDNATVTARLDLPAGAKRKVRFAIAWYVPVYVNPVAPIRSDAELKPEYRGKVSDYDALNHIKKYYATKFGNAGEAAFYALKNFNRLYRETDKFRRALFGSTIPRPILEAVSRNLAILKSATFIRMEDGFLYGFEGTGRDYGSCDGNCSHVYNYAYALAFLFPDLERQFREAEFVDNLDANGKMSFRVMLPRKEHLPWGFRACCDGQFGAVIKLYRDYLLSGDIDWVKSLWKNVKLAISYAWSAQNPDRWDPQKTGIL